MRTLLPTALLLATLGTADATAAPVACTLGTMTRTIEVIYSDPGQAVPCEVLYGKPEEGTHSTPWRATNESGYCEARAAELAAKLEGLGWACATRSMPGSDASEQKERADA